MKKIQKISIIIILWLQYSLWFGKHGIIDYLTLKNEIDNLKNINKILKKNNTNLFLEINDLNQENEIIEEIARNELNMIKPEETLYRITKK